jgi:hypothetical protein
MADAGPGRTMVGSTSRGWCSVVAATQLTLAPFSPRPPVGSGCSPSSASAVSSTASRWAVRSGRQPPNGTPLGSLRTTLWRLRRIGPPLVDVRGDRLALAATVEVDLRSFTAAAAALIARPAGELTDRWKRPLRSCAAMVTPPRRSTRRYGPSGSNRLRESAHRVLIVAHLWEGNVVEAVRQFESLRWLRDELSVEPSPGLVALLSDRVPNRTEYTKLERPLTDAEVAWWTS